MKNANNNIKRTIYVGASGTHPLVLMYFTWLYLNHTQTFRRMMNDVNTHDTCLVGIDTKLNIPFIEYIEKRSQELLPYSRTKLLSSSRKEKKALSGLSAIQKMTEVQLIDLNYSY